MIAMDNQQETTVGWFTGILEGEAYWDEKSKIYAISNTDLDIILGCEQYLKKNLIWFVRGTRYRKRGRPEYIIRISNSSVQIFQYTTLLTELIRSCLQCRFQSNLGSSETTRELSVDIDWLSGIYEAEGSFSLVFDNRDNVQFGITLPNTNEKIIDKILINLRSLGCAYYIYDKPKAKSFHKRGWIISINGMKRCQRFLRKMEGKWVSERNQKRTALMQEFISSRFDQRLKDPYTLRQYQIVQAMIDLNR